MGIAASARFVGIAVTMDGEPVQWEVSRILRDDVRHSRAQVSSLLASVLPRFRPVAIVNLIDDGTDPRRAMGRDVTARIVQPAIALVALPVIEVMRSELVRDLGFGEASNAALLVELLRRTPVNTMQVTAHRDREEAERYWATAVLATGATQVPFREAATVCA